MKGSHLVILLIALTAIVVFAVVRSNQSNVEEGEGLVSDTTTVQDQAQVQESKPEPIVNQINLTDGQLKKSIEKTENGIVISNVKINSNNNNIINVSLNAKNTNKVEKIVTLAVKYYDDKGKQIGENGFALGSMKAGESKDIDSTCYIESADVADTKIEITADDIVVDDKNDNSGTAGDATTGVDATKTTTTPAVN